MSDNNWFVEAMKELVNEARQHKKPNVLAGLRSAVEAYCIEANLSDREARRINCLLSLDTTKDTLSNTHCVCDVSSACVRT